jgi:SagB-type dehydrogenase family enzyme
MKFSQGKDSDEPQAAFSKFFHQLTKKIPNTQAGEAPAAWSTLFYKQYPSVKRIPLVPKTVQADLFDVLIKRRSTRVYGGGAIPKENLATVLTYGCGVVPGTQMRTYPSGGMRYPIEVYPFVIKGNSDVPSGLYHYSVKDSVLESVYEHVVTAAEIDSLFPYPWIHDASIVLFMTATFSRTQAKYKERGYRLILTEAGHIAQNISLVSEALNIKHCVMAGTYDSAVEDLIDIDGVTESLVYAVVLGTA